MKTSNSAKQFVWMKKRDRMQSNSLETELDIICIFQNANDVFSQQFHWQKM